MRSACSIMSTSASITNMTDYSETAGLAAASPPGGALPGAGSLEGVSAALSGAPDPAWIAQLANSIFNESPGAALPAAGASQPSMSATAADPHLSANPGAPGLEAPISPSQAPAAPFLIPTPSGGAGQPSAPIYAYEPGRPSAYLPPSSPSGGALAAAPFQAYEPSRPTAYLPPSSSGGGAPAAPVHGYEALHPGSYLPPSSPAGAASPSSPVQGYEPSAFGSAPGAPSTSRADPLSLPAYSYASIWPVTAVAPALAGLSPHLLPPGFLDLVLPQGGAPESGVRYQDGSVPWNASSAPSPAGLDSEPSYRPASQPSGSLPARADQDVYGGSSSGAPHYGGQPYGAAPGPNTAAPAAPG
jgi:hypothetical protein